MRESVIGWAVFDVLRSDHFDVHIAEDEVDDVDEADWWVFAVLCLPEDAKASERKYLGHYLACCSSRHFFVVCVRKIRVA